MLETQKIDICECEKPLKPEKSVVITTRRTRVLFVIALILIGLAILSLIGAVVLVVRFSGTCGFKYYLLSLSFYGRLSSGDSPPSPLLSCNLIGWWRSFDKHPLTVLLYRHLTIWVLICKSNRWWKIMARPGLKPRTFWVTFNISITYIKSFYVCLECKIVVKHLTIITIRWCYTGNLL